MDNITQNNYIELVRSINKEREMRTGKPAAAMITTYGCQQNVSDSEHIRGLLAEMGYSFCTNAEEADLAVFNTCAVREHAEQRVFGNVGALKGIKQSRPSMLIAVCGCMAQQESVAEKLRRSYPYVDLVFGTHMLGNLPKMLHGALGGSRVFELGGGDDVEEGLPAKRDSRFKAWLPVMYGCNNFCTYCIVPYVRGRERSRSPEAVLDEAKRLIDGGAKEITLLGQNVNSYGRDKKDGVDFARLLGKLDALDGDFRIRFMTSHPKDATAELFDAMAQSKKVSRHLHLPFQSGSSRILRLMNRGYTREQYLKLVEELRRRIPDVSLTSDVIVGFPGETHDDFLETLSLAREVGFDNLFTFIYSRRGGTPAAGLDDPVPHAEKARWLSELLTEQENITSSHMAKMVGGTFRVLCDDESDGIAMGRTDSNLVVRFPADGSKVGKFVRVKVTQAARSALSGELVD